LSTDAAARNKPEKSATIVVPAVGEWGATEAVERKKNGDRPLSHHHPTFQLVYGVDLSAGYGLKESYVVSRRL